MAVKTHAQVAAVSKIKLATAFLFLGGAALAASAAGGLAGKSFRAPDLIITSIQFVKADAIGNGENDKLRFNYQNLGTLAVNSLFHIRGEVVGKSVKIEKVTKTVPAKGKGYVEVFFPKTTQNSYPANGLKISAYIDFDEKNPKGKIIETNENNNVNTVVIPKTEVSFGVPLSENVIPPATASVSFCNADAVKDAQICEKRFTSSPDLANSIGILKNHQCVGVYKGLPIIKDANSDKFTTLDWDSTAKVALGYNLDACSKSGPQAASTEIVKACIDEMYQSMKKLPFLLDQNECPHYQSLCTGNPAGFDNVCQKRLQLAGYSTDQAATIVATFQCSAVHFGIPIVEKGGQFFTMMLDTTANVLFSTPLSGCSKTGGNAAASSLEQARECVNELYGTFSKQALYLPQCAQNSETYCKVSAEANQNICEKRLKSVTGLTENQFSGLLSKYACQGVYRGFPVLKTVEGQYQPLTWNTYDNFVEPINLSSCGLVKQGQLPASSVVVQNCIDQLETISTIQNSPFYFGEDCSVDTCSTLTKTKANDFVLCQNENLPFACFGKDGQFETCTNSPSACSAGATACQVF